MASKREQELLEENVRLRQENALLRQKVDLLIKRIFGAGSEKMDAGQLQLLLGGEDEPGTERSEIDWPLGQPEGWSASDIKTTGARVGGGGPTALEGPILPA